MTGYAVVRSHVQSLVVAGGFPLGGSVGGSFPGDQGPGWAPGLSGDHLVMVKYGKPQRAW